MAMHLQLTNHQRTLLRNIGTLLSGTLLARALGMVGVVLLARIVGPASYGYLASSLVVTKLAAVFFSLGLDHWLLRYGGRASDDAALAKHGTTCLALKGGLGLLWWLGLAAVAPWLDQKTFPMAIFLFAGLIVWFEEVANVVWATFNSASANRTAASLLTVYQLLQFLAITGPALFGVTFLELYVLSQTIAAAMGTSFAIFWLRRRFRFRLDWADMKQTFKGSGMFALSLGLSLVYGRADVAIVAIWLGNAAVGIYSPAVSLVMTALLIPLTIYSVVLPLLSRAHAEDQAALARLAVETTVGSTLLGLIMGGALAFLSTMIVRIIFGEQYLAVGDLLFILSGVILFRCPSFALASIITAVGWQRHRTVVQAVAALVNIGLNLWVVTRWGIMGIANVFVLTEALLMIGYLTIVLYWFTRYRHQAQPALL